jgi:hypothetical protein
LFWQGMCSHELMRRNTVPSSSSMPSVRREVLCSRIQGCQITTAARAAFCPTTCPENCPTGLCHPEVNSDKHVTNLRRREDGTLQRPLCRREDGTLQRPLCPRSSSPPPPPPPPPMVVNNPLLVGGFDPFRRCCAVARARPLVIQRFELLHELEETSSKHQPPSVVLAEPLGREECLLTNNA